MNFDSKNLWKHLKWMLGDDWLFDEMLMMWQTQRNQNSISLTHKFKSFWTCSSWELSLDGHSQRCLTTPEPYRIASEIYISSGRYVPRHVPPAIDQCLFAWKKWNLNSMFQYIIEDETQMKCTTPETLCSVSCPRGCPFCRGFSNHMHSVLLTVLCNKAKVKAYNKTRTSFFALWRWQQHFPTEGQHRPAAEIECSRGKLTAWRSRTRSAAASVHATPK